MDVRLGSKDSLAMMEEAEANGAKFSSAEHIQGYGPSLLAPEIRHVTLREHQNIDTRLYHSISMQNTALHARDLLEKIFGLYQATIESIYINLELYYHDIDVQLLD